MRSIDPWGLTDDDKYREICAKNPAWAQGQGKGICDKLGRAGGNENDRSFAENPASTQTSDSCGPPDLLGDIWALPNTAAGLVAGGIDYAASLAAGADPYITFGNNAIQFNNTIIGGGAITIGNVEIFTLNRPAGFTSTPDYLGWGPDIVTANHEEAHTYQSQALGPLFGPTWALLGAASSRNPLETSADIYAERWGGPFAGFSNSCK